MKKPEQPEQMAEFFNKRAEGYDDHMRETLSDVEALYDSISTCIASTQDKIHVLDIGVGTGLELKGIFKQAPNAIITGIDISEKMLDKLKENYAQYIKQITLVRESYLTFPVRKRITLAPVDVLPVKQAEDAAASSVST